MKATLEFNLPEDEWDFTTASSAISLVTALKDFDETLRTKIKHEGQETIDLHEVRHLLWSTLQEYNVNGLLV